VPDPRSREGISALGMHAPAGNVAFAPSELRYEQRADDFATAGQIRAATEKVRGRRGFKISVERYDSSEFKERPRLSRTHGRAINGALNAAAPMPPRRSRAVIGHHRVPSAARQGYAQGSENDLLPRGRWSPAGHQLRL